MCMHIQSETEADLAFVNLRLLRKHPCSKLENPSTIWLECKQGHGASESWICQIPWYGQDNLVTALDKVKLSITATSFLSLSWNEILQNPLACSSNPKVTSPAFTLLSNPPPHLSLAPKTNLVFQYSHIYNEFLIGCSHGIEAKELDKGSPFNRSKHSNEEYGPSEWWHRLIGLSVPVSWELEACRLLQNLWAFG